MIRKVMICLSVLAAAGMSAAPLTPEQALQRMTPAVKKGKVASLRLEKEPAMTIMSKDGVAGVYVFNSKDGNGYRILSADDVAYPVLGYSDSGTLSEDEMSPELRWWLDGMAEQIAMAASRGAKTAVAPKADPSMTAINPMVSSKWNQDGPYNENSPLLNGKRCYTGCVATSMAQLMNYFKYPEHGQGTITYEWTRGSKKMSMDFSTKKFDWGNMLDIYNTGNYSSVQAEAVANLMEACGYAVQMNFGTEASGTQGSLIAEALKDYFGYDCNTYVDFRAIYSASEWAKKVWDNLKNVGPVIFNGHPYNDGGHSFVCDGYDGDGFFHFNWGWGGVSDGYYLLECMDPSAQGIGGSSGGGFNYGLNGIFGAQKPTGKPEELRFGNIIMYGGCTATVSGSSITFSRNKWYPDGWFCGAGEPIKVAMGARIEPIDGTPGEIVDKSGRIFGGVNMSLNPGSYYPTQSGPVIQLPALADGRYKVTVITKQYGMGDNARWNPIWVNYGAPNYVYLTAKNGEYTVENIPVPELTPENVTLNSGLYYGRMADFQAVIKNNSDYELTETLVPALLIGDAIAMVGNVAPTTVNAKSSATVSWPAKMIARTGFAAPSVAKEYELAIIDPITEKILGRYGKVTMKPAPKLASMVVATDFNIDGVTPETEQLTENRKVSVYTVPGQKFDVNLSIAIQRSFYDGVISLGIYNQNVDNPTEFDPYLLGLYKNQPFLESGATKEYKIPIDFTEAKNGELYALRCYYTSGNNNSIAGTVYFRVANTGINDILAEESEDAPRYFNLQGVEIPEPAKGQIVIVRKGSKAAKVIF